MENTIDRGLLSNVLGHAALANRAGALPVVQLLPRLQPPLSGRPNLRSELESRLF